MSAHPSRFARIRPLLELSQRLHTRASSPASPMPMQVRSARTVRPFRESFPVAYGPGPSRHPFGRPLQRRMPVGGQLPLIAAGPISHKYKTGRGAIRGRCVEQVLSERFGRP